jgi:hypothetical protein
MAKLVFPTRARQLGRNECASIELDLTNEQLAVAARMSVFTVTRRLCT